MKRKLVLNTLIGVGLILFVLGFSMMLIEAASIESGMKFEALKAMIGFILMGSGTYILQDLEEYAFNEDDYE